MSIKISRPLRRGDVVALINPAGVLPDRFKNQYEYIGSHLVELGFVVRSFVVESSWEEPRRRSDALMRAFMDSDVNAIFPICGGVRIYDILPFIDYGTLADHPKIICGSSELSALVANINARSGIVTFFGPHLNFLNPKASKLENKFTVRSFWNMLQWDWHGKNGLDNNESHHFFHVPHEPILPIVVHNIYREPAHIRNNRYRDNFFYAVDPNTDVSGELLIGSLYSLVRLCEDGFTPNVFGKIVMLDSLDASLETISRLFDIFNGYCDLSRAAAIVFSSFTERTDKKYLEYPELKNHREIVNFLQGISGSLRYGQIFYGFPVGHCAYKLTLPIGVRVSISAINGDLALLESPYQ